jgi:hypothetical protein
MNKHVPAPGAALSILAFTPAIAQEQPAAPAINCAPPENANNAACINQRQMQQQVPHQR